MARQSERNSDKHSEPASSSSSSSERGSRRNGDKDKRVCYDRRLPQDVNVPPRAPMPARAPGGARGAAGPAAAAGPGSRLRAAFEIAKLWPNGSTLHVRFMGGTPQQQNTVRQFAPQWSQFANLTLDFDDASDAQIRIAFEDDGSWSYIGKDCLGIPRNTHTMNFGWLDEAVVLHEFGHALGLIHEHQNPLGGIHWNKEAVYRDLGGSPNFWDRATVDRNMFETYDVNQINGTQLDPKSIMLYRVPRAWTTDGFESQFNGVLSPTDKAHAGRVYPFADRRVTELPVREMASTAADIGSAGEEDLFKFTAASAGRYTVETEGPTDVVMSLLGPNSQTSQIAQDDDSGTDRNARIVADLAPGTYFVQVRHYSQGGIGAYNIRVSR